MSKNQKDENITKKEDDAKDFAQEFANKLQETSIAQDMNEDNQISSGVLDPFQPSEWFYYYPDTIKIRSNWELELDQITLGKEF